MILLSDLYGAIRDRMPGESFTVSQLQRMASAAVREYNRWNPVIREDVFETVAGEDEYELPDNCLFVLDCVWFPSSPLADEEWAGSPDQAATLSPYAFISHRVIDAANREMAYQYAKGFWNSEPGSRTISLSPVPDSSGIPVTLRYAAAHVLNEEKTAYATIPAEDLDILADLAIARFLETKAAEMALEPDYQLGMQREQFRSIPENALRVADKLREGIRAKYGGVYASLIP